MVAVIKKLEIFGDSILRGVLFDAAHNKYRLCDDHQYGSLAELGVLVQNNAKMGATVEKGAAIFEKRLTAIDADTTVLLEFGGNDCDYDWQAISEDPTGSFLPHTPEKTFVTLYENMIQKAKRKGARVILATLIPIDCDKYMQWITRGRSYDNVLRWLGDIPHLTRWQAYYNQLVENLARTMNCPLLDLRGALTLENKMAELICADGIHPTQAGHDIIHHTIRKTVAAIV